MAEWYSVICSIPLYHILFIHSSVDGHLCCFQVLAAINSAAMNIGKHVFFQICFSPDIYPGVGLQGHMVQLVALKFFLNFYLIS